MSKQLDSGSQSVNFSDIVRAAGSLVREDTSRTLTQADSGKTFVSINGGSSPVAFTLPATAEPGTIYTFIGDSENCRITVPTGVTMRMPWGSVTNDSIDGEDDRGDLEASLQIIAETSTSWAVRYGTGGWKLDDGSVRHWYDGWVQGGNENMVVTFDAYSAIQDSSRAVYRLDQVSYDMSITGGSAYTINTAAAWHAVEAFLSGSGYNMDFLAGKIGTDITAYATHDSGASTKVTTTAAHGLSVGDIITITGTTNYNDIYEVIEVVDTTNFVIDKAWDTNDDATGTYARPDMLKAKANYAGSFHVIWSLGGSIAVSSAECDFGVFKNKTLQAKIPRKFQTAADVGAVAGNAFVTMSVGDVIWFGMRNKDNTNNITIEEMEFVAHRL